MQRNEDKQKHIMWGAHFKSPWSEQIRLRTMFNHHEFVQDEILTLFHKGLISTLILFYVTEAQFSRYLNYNSLQTQGDQQHSWVINRHCREIQFPLKLSHGSGFLITPTTAHRPSPLSCPSHRFSNTIEQFSHCMWA